MNNFSPNMLKTFEQCEIKFFHKYVQKLSVPQRSTLFEKGKKIHALANYYLSGANIERMEKTLTKDEKTAWESLKTNKYFEFTKVQTEYNLSCKIGDFWVGGRLDALMIDTQSSPDYYILDYKTGSIPKNAQEDFQTIVYLLCVEKYLKNKKIPYNSLQFIYLGLKNNEEKSILLTEELKNTYEKKITEICKKIDFAINSNVFQKNTSNCINCEYKSLCLL